MTKCETELANCAFCNGSSEMDLRRTYYDWRGRPRTAIAIYCLQCDADMMRCRADTPSLSDEEIVADLVAKWNRRASQDALSKAEAV